MAEDIPPYSDAEVESALSRASSHDAGDLTLKELKGCQDRVKQLECNLAQSRALLKETEEQLNSLYSYLAWQSSPDTRYECTMMRAARAVLDKIKHQHSELLLQELPAQDELGRFIQTCKAFGIENEKMIRAAWKGLGHANTQDT